MYVAPRSDWDWLLNAQRKLYERSKENLDYVFQKVWGLVTDPRNLRVALARVARNRGARTAGVDRITVRRVILDGVEGFIDRLRKALRSGSYRANAVRQVKIPKSGKPGKFRVLGIPTVKDRTIQAAIKNIMEPIFEPDFYPCSYGFRPGRSVHGALEHLRMLLRPAPRNTKSAGRLPYQWVIEGDIRACFDNIDHHALMNRIRRRMADPKLNRLIAALLKSGAMAEGQFLRTDAGTPQGGILSPLLANIALGTIEERYERHVWPRRSPSPLTHVRKIELRAVSFRYMDQQRGRPIFFPIRYADDFLVLVKAPPGPDQYDRAREFALKEKDELARHLKEQLNLDLSEEKTKVTPVTDRIPFLGHHVCVRRHPTHGRTVSTAVVPRDRSQKLRETIKRIFRFDTVGSPLTAHLKRLNPILRGWATFYRHAWGAKRVFARLDHYVWWTIFRWLRKKHRFVPVKELYRRYARRTRGSSVQWHDGSRVRYQMQKTTVCQFKLGWTRPPIFANPSMESPVRNERRTPGSKGGTRKPAGESP